MLEKAAISAKQVHDRVAKAAPHASATRLHEFTTKMRGEMVHQNNRGTRAILKHKDLNKMNRHDEAFAKRREAVHAADTSKNKEASMSPFGSELSSIFEKQAISLAQVGKLVPGAIKNTAAEAAMGTAKTMRPPAMAAGIKDTLRGSVVPGVAAMRAEHAGLEGVNHALAGAKSILR